MSAACSKVRNLAEMHAYLITHNGGQHQASPRVDNGHTLDISRVLAFVKRISRYEQDHLAIGCRFAPPGIVISLRFVLRRCLPILTGD